MKAVILYKPDSEFARQAEEFAHDFAHQTPFTVELINVDGPEGDPLAKLYDAVQYPALLVTRDDGGLMKMWQGVPLPLINEVAGYLAA